MNDSIAASNGTNIEVNGARYYVRDSGIGEHCVMLLHGWPDDGTLWRYQFAALQHAGYRVICPDLLGHGKSKQPDALERYTFTAQVADIVGLLDALGLTTVHCIAHDYGAVLGWELAAAHPDRLKTFVAMSVGHLAAMLALSLEAMRYNWIYVFNLHELAPTLYRAHHGQLLREVLRGHPDRDQIVDRFLRSENPRYIDSWEKANPLPQFLLAALEGNLPEFVPVRVPTFGIWSTGEDFMLEAPMKQSGTYVEAEWRYERIEDANHWFMLERPDETNRLLLAWLQNHL